MGTKNKLTIVNDVGVYEDYPWEKLDSRVRSVLETAALRVPLGRRGQMRPLLKLLECYLQVTNQELPGASLKTKSLHAAWIGFLGALQSDQFCSGSPKWRRLMCGAAVSLRLHAGGHRLAHRTESQFVREALSLSNIESSVAAFRKLRLHQEKVWLWRGWPSKNKRGVVTWFPLLSVYQRLGREFTERMYQQLDIYFSARRGSHIPCLKYLCRFIGQYEGLTNRQLLDPLFVSRFWRDFFLYYIETGYTDGMEPPTMLANWRNNFLSVIEDFLTAPDLIAEPWGVLPMPEPRTVRGENTNVRISSKGEAIKEKLITDVPLDLTDDAAMHVLIKQIRSDFDHIITWAECACDEIWERYLRVRREAKFGAVRPWPKKGNRKTLGEAGALWLMDRKNADHFKNASATFLHYGYPGPGITNLFPNPRKQTASELALPVASALLPHCALLVANHPEITTSFLSSLELFDKNGKRVGFVDSKSGCKLVSYKARNGTARAQQIIDLNPMTAEIVRQVIALTDPLRSYLRRRENDDWRYLLLTCGTAFGEPSRVKRLATDTSMRSRVASTATALAQTTGLSIRDAKSLAARFTLTTLRATAGVRVYLDTRSVARMAEALGHARYDQGLLSRYLPEPILRFFQDRWVRIFQTGIIVEALKNSEYLLDASGFRTMEDLERFLSNHVLRDIPENLALDPDEQAELTHENLVPDREVVFGVDVPALTLLLELREAVHRASHPVSAKAIYWADIGSRLIDFISGDAIRADLNVYLQEAKRRANPSRLEHLINA